MIRAILLTSVFAAIIITQPITGSKSFAMSGEGCGAGTCADCHSLDKEEAKEIFKGWGDDVGEVEFSQVPGMWTVEIKKGGKSYPVYIDFSKSYAFTGNIIKIEGKENITRKRFFKSNPVDFDAIPLEDALLLGSEKAKTKVIVFTDPQCPYCVKLHHELEKVVEADPSIAFYIKLFPLVAIHPKAKGIAESIVCAKIDPERGPRVAMSMLETSFDKGDIPPATCETNAINKNIELAKKIGVRSTPTLILPGGIIEPGSKDANRMLELLGSSKRVEVSESEETDKKK